MTELCRAAEVSAAALAAARAAAAAADLRARDLTAALSAAEARATAAVAAAAAEADERVRALQTELDATAAAAAEHRALADARTGNIQRRFTAALAVASARVGSPYDAALAPGAVAAAAGAGVALTGRAGDDVCTLLVMLSEQEAAATVSAARADRAVAAEQALRARVQELRALLTAAAAAKGSQAACCKCTAAAGSHSTGAKDPVSAAVATTELEVTGGAGRSDEALLLRAQLVTLSTRVMAADARTAAASDEAADSRARAADSATTAAAATERANAALSEVTRVSAANASLRRALALQRRISARATASKRPASTVCAPPAAAAAAAAVASVEDEAAAAPACECGCRCAAHCVDGPDDQDTCRCCCAAFLVEATAAATTANNSAAYEEPSFARPKSAPSTPAKSRSGAQSLLSPSASGPLAAAAAAAGEAAALRAAVAEAAAVASEAQKRARAAEARAQAISEASRAESARAAAALTEAQENAAMHKKRAAAAEKLLRMRELRVAALEAAAASASANAGAGDARAEELARKLKTAKEDGARHAAALKSVREKAAAAEAVAESARATAVAEAERAAAATERLKRARAELGSKDAQLQGAKETVCRLIDLCEARYLDDQELEHDPAAADAATRALAAGAVPNLPAAVPHCPAALAVGAAADCEGGPTLRSRIELLEARMHATHTRLQQRTKQLRAAYTELRARERRAPLGSPGGKTSMELAGTQWSLKLEAVLHRLGAVVPPLLRAAADAARRVTAAQALCVLRAVAEHQCARMVPVQRQLEAALAGAVDAGVLPPDSPLLAQVLGSLAPGAAEDGARQGGQLSLVARALSEAETAFARVSTDPAQWCALATAHSNSEAETVGAETSALEGELKAFSHQLLAAVLPNSQSQAQAQAMTAETLPLSAAGEALLSRVLSPSAALTAAFSALAAPPDEFLPAEDDAATEMRLLAPSLRDRALTQAEVEATPLLQRRHWALIASRAVRAVCTPVTPSSITDGPDNGSEPAPGVFGALVGLCDQRSDLETTLGSVVAAVGICQHDRGTQSALGELLTAIADAKRGRDAAETAAAEASVVAAEARRRAVWAVRTAAAEKAVLARTASKRQASAGRRVARARRAAGQMRSVLQRCQCTEGRRLWRALEPWVPEVDDSASEPDAEADSDAEADMQSGGAAVTRLTGDA